MTDPDITVWLAPAALYVLGALVALALPSRARVASHAIAAVASAIGIAAAASTLLAGATERISLFSAGPYFALVPK